MLSWFIFIGIITGFMIGTYYLYHYWNKPMRELEDFYEESNYRRPETVPRINRKTYEMAYEVNTSFSKEETGEKIPEHRVYAFHRVKPTQEEKPEEELAEAAKQSYEPDYEPDIEENNTGKQVEEDSKLPVEPNNFDVEADIVETFENSGADPPEEVEEKKTDDETSLIKFRQIEENNKGGIKMPELQQVGGLELIKTPVVIGENVIQKMEVTDLPLDMTAIKVRDISARIMDIVTDVIQDKVIIQGIIHKQIFFVGTDNIIHHQSEDIEFSTFVDVPGAEPGMDVLVEPTIEHVIARLILDGNVLHQKVVVQFFVKVLSVQQLIVETGMGPLVRVEKVIGENAVQTMVINDVVLAVEAIKIVDITAEVRELETEVIQDKVIIQGIVHKQLFYIGTDDVEHHQAEDIPFSEFVDIPGAEPGMNVQVHPTIEHVKQELSPDGTTVTQEIVLELFVKVTESVQVNLVTGNDSLVMLPEVIGENLKQILSETTLELSQPAIKIKEIVATFVDLNAVVIQDKVIIQGVIHKQIFFVNEDNIEIHQAENVPFSTFVDVMGARPGMDVEIIPTVAFVKPVLSSDGTLLTQKVIGDIFVKVTENIQFNVSEVGPYGV